MKTIYKVGIGMISLLQYIHYTGYLHLDLKEDNNVIITKPMKINGKDQNFILIDFGLASRYLNNKE